MTKAPPLQPTTRLPDGAVLLSDELRGLFGVLKVACPSPLLPEHIPDLVEQARAAIGPDHPLLTPLVNEQLAELLALAPADPSSGRPTPTPAPPADPPLCLIDIRSVLPRRPREHSHTTYTATVLARSYEEAIAVLCLHSPWMLEDAVHVAETGRHGLNVARVVTHSTGQLSPSTVAALTGKPE